MADPFTVAIGVVMYGLTRNVGERLATRYINVPYEQARIEQTEVEKQRLQEECMRHEERMAFDRQRHIEEISARFDLQTQQNRLDNWPFTVSAADVIARSAANNHKALNLFLVAKDGSGQPYAPQRSKTLDEISAWLGEHYAEIYATHPVIAYINPFKPHAPSGEALISTIYGMLKYEPTLIFEYEESESGTITLAPKLWGIGGEYEAPPYPLGKVTIELQLGSNQAQERFILSLKTYIASLVDVFFLTITPDSPLAPIMHRTILPEIMSQPEYQEGDSETIVKLLPPIYAVYHNIAPQIGLGLSETFIKALHNTGNRALARACLLDLHAQIARCQGFKDDAAAPTNFAWLESMRHFSIPTLDRLNSALEIVVPSAENRRPLMKDRGFSSS